MVDEPFRFVDPFYRELCSERTLAQPQRGFFAQLADHVTDAADADWLARFAALRSDAARVGAVYALPQVRSALANAAPVFRGKDAVASRRRRLAGDVATAGGQLDAAVALYTQAVVRAPHAVTTPATLCDAGPGNGDTVGVVGKKKRRRGRGTRDAGVPGVQGGNDVDVAAANPGVGVGEKGPEGEGGEPESGDAVVEAGRGKRRRRRPKKPAPTPMPTPTPTPIPTPIPTPTEPTEAACDDAEPALALALAARATALAALGKHRLALLDVREALAQGCPREERPRLYSLLASSCEALGLRDLVAACAHLAQAPHDAQRVADRAVDAADRMEQAQTPERPTLAGGASSALVDASARLQLAETAASGRFVVAGEPLATGDTLLVQSPHAAVAFSEADATHCHHCLLRLEAGVACERCSGLAFCSPRCRALASGYHALECSFHDLLVGSGASALCRLALRIVTQRPLRFFVSLLGASAPERGGDGDGYLDAHSLETHATRRGVDDFLQRAIMALFLLRVLQRAGYFPHASADHAEVLGEDELLIGSLLLRHLQLLQFNAHEITETRASASGRLQVANVGVGVYPTAALFNHDCHPAVARHFVGTRMQLRLLRPVARGAPVAENYGPAFTQQGVALRRRALQSRYWFHCECCACRQDWPVLDKLPTALFRFRCPTAECAGVLSLPPAAAAAAATTRCASCRRAVSVRDAAAELANAEGDRDGGRASLDAGRFADAADRFARFLDRVHRLGAPPDRHTLAAEAGLRTCFAWLALGSGGGGHSSATSG